MDTENELGPTMKIFTWRGPSRSDVMGVSPETATSSALGLVPVVAKSTQVGIPSASSIEIRLAEAVVRVVQGIDESLLTKVLRAVRNPHRSQAARFRKASRYQYCEIESH